MQPLDRHRVLVGEPESSDPEDGVIGCHMQPCPESSAGRLDAGRDETAGAHESASPHVLREGQDRHALSDLWPDCEGRGALPSYEVPVSFELVERPTHGHPRYPEPDTQVPLRRDRGAGRECLDDFHDVVAQGEVLGARRRRSRRSGLCGRTDTCQLIPAGHRRSVPPAISSSWNRPVMAGSSQTASAPVRLARQNVASAPAASPTVHSTGWTR